MRKFICLLLLWTPGWFFGQIQQYEYWFDADYANKVSQNITQQTDYTFQDNLDISSLENGIHSYSIRFKAVNKEWSSVLTQFIYKLPEVYLVENPKIVKYEFWFDTSYENKVTQNTSVDEVVVLIEDFATSELENGIHSFSLRFQDENNDWSSVLTQFIYKLPEVYLVENPKIVKYEYWFDANYENKVTQNTPIDEVVILNENFDVSSLSNSIHVVNIRFQDEHGDWSSILSQFFYYTESQLIILKEITSYQYWFNDDFENQTATAVTASSQYELDTFVIPENAGIGIGTHTFHLRFKDNAGMWSSVLSETFEVETLAVDIPVGNSNFKLYPNPTTGVLNFHLGKYYNEITIKVYDLNGRLIFQTEKQNSMELSIPIYAPAGFYVIAIEADSEKTTRKIIKK